MKIYKFNILLIISLFAIVSLTTCKKYPQDGQLSCYTVNDRLTTNWVLVECIIDGEDVTNKVFNYSSYSYSLNEAVLTFDYYKDKMANGKYKKVYSSFLEIVHSNDKFRTSAISNYEFRNFKKYLFFDSNSSYANIPLLQNPTNELWTIKKLLKKDLIIETTNSLGNKITITFKGS